MPHQPISSNTLSSFAGLPQTQAEFWNGPAGQSWVQAQALTDEMLMPFVADLLASVRTSGAQRVLDVGCGTGAVSCAVASELAGTGRCTGVDISAPMIAAAQARAQGSGAEVEFIRADVQDHVFSAGAYDLIISRFGVMFFDDVVKAFRTLHAATASSGRLCCIAWRGPEENPFMTTAERAVAPLLGEFPRRLPHAPGQFGFADRDWVQQQLERSGWQAVEILPIDRVCRFPYAALNHYLSHLGPVGRALQDLDAHTQAEVFEVLRAAFAPYRQGDELRFTAACWLIKAQARL